MISIQNILLFMSLVTGFALSDEPLMTARQREIVFRCPPLEKMADNQKKAALASLQFGFTSEGNCYLVDSKDGSFWYERNRTWSKLAVGLFARKEFGGMSPMLDIRFVGEHRFLLSYTSSKEGEKPMKATTILLSENGIEAITSDYLASSGPFIKVPRNWFKDFKISNEYRGPLD